MAEKIKLRERRDKVEMKNNLEEVNFFKNEKLNKKQGITLIALVVTIVVLLILASVSITVVFGDNGILQLAKEAGEKTNEAVEKEQGDITNLTNDIKDFVNGEKTLVQLFKEGELKVGDYINYANPTEGSYTAKAEKTGMNRAEGYNISDQTFSVANNPLNWRILGIDKATGGLKLISGRPIKSDRVTTGAKDPYFYMYGANAYLNGDDELDNIARIFKNETYAQDVRSVTAEDINEAIGINGEQDLQRFDCTGTYGKEYSFENQYTPEAWLEELKEMETKPEVQGSKKGLVSGIADAYAYYVNSKTYNSVEVKDESLFNMLFGNIDTTPGESRGAYYWLNSKCTLIRNNNGSAYCCGFGFGGVYKGGDLNLVTVQTNSYLFSSLSLRRGSRACRLLRCASCCYFKTRTYIKTIAKNRISY